ncbi:hypothetical protein V8F06_006280 [Rhypophila decipiens]
MSSDDMWESRDDGRHPEIMRQQGVIAPECYLADERQGYLVLLLQFVRSNNPRSHLPGLPQAGRSTLAIQARSNASNNWGLDLPYTQLSRYFEPSAQRITLFHDIWDAIANAANDLCAYVAEYQEDISIGDKLEFMAMSEFSLHDLVHERNPKDLILLIGRILSRATNDNPDCTCRLLSELGPHHPDEISSLDWPEFVLAVAHPFFGEFFPAMWSEAVDHDQARNPLSDWYRFPTMRISPDMQQFEYSSASAREDALGLFLLNDFTRLYGEFKTTNQFEDCLLKGEAMMRQCELNIAAQQELVNEEFVANGGSELFCVSSDGHNMPVFTVTEEERNLTLRHRMNPPIRRYWECEDDGSDPMIFPERWARLV